LDLLERIRSGHYGAQSVHRAYIPKADGSLRPLGIRRQGDATRVGMVLEAIYRQDYWPVALAFGRAARPIRRFATCATPLMDKRLKMIDKWLKVGTVEDGVLRRATGSARGCDLSLPLEPAPCAG
jgi:RNA-directed DNA polymerase